jgi:hypothetical protein
MLKRTAVLTAALVFSVYAAAASATEGSNQHWAIGANTGQPAIMPGPGDTAWLEYNQYYTANAFLNAQGKSAIAGYNISVFAEAARIIHTWDINWDGWHLSSQIIATAVHTDLWRGGSSHFSGIGFGDFEVTPFYVSKNFGAFNILGGLDSWYPTGTYSKSNVVNEGLNYMTFAPEFAITFHPNERLMASLDCLTMFNTENPATHYLSGSSENIDYQIGYRPFDDFKSLQIGASGYYFAQFTNDISDGAVVAGGGDRGRAFAVGPQVRYDLKGGALIFKWQKELAVLNRPEGNRFWFQFALKL